MVKILKVIFLIGVCVTLIVGAAGCTNPTQQTTQSTAAPSSNKAIDYANAMLQGMKGTLAANVTMTSSKVMANGSDGARFTVTQVNHGGNASSSNGTVAISVKVFSNKDDASAFFDNATFGYTKDDAASMANMTYYKTAFGHDATINNGSHKVESVFPLTASEIMQQDEFVSTWDISSV
jgi:hypothetical protein